MTETQSAPPSKWRPWFFIIGFFLLPNAIFLMTYLYNMGANEELYQKEHEYENLTESMTLTLPLGENLDIRSVGLLIESIQKELHAGNLGKLRQKNFHNDEYTIVIQSADVDKVNNRIRYLIKDLGEIEGGVVSLQYNGDKTALSYEINNGEHEAGSKQE